MVTINLLNILLLLVFYIDIGSADIHSEYMEAQEEHIALANQYRRAFAKKFQISNMHELVWDGSVQQIAKDNQNEKPLPAEEFRYHKTDLLTADTAKEVFREVLEDRNERYFRDHILEYENGPMYPLDLLLPAQKKIGCSWYNGGPNPSICVLSPEIYFASFFEARGAPGSKCDKGYTNNDGLCSLPKGT